jgi:hypothetical protein
LLPIFCFLIPLEARLSKLFPFSRCRFEKGRAGSGGHCAGAPFRSNPQKFSYPLLWDRCMENKKCNGTNRAQTLGFYLQQLKGGDSKMADETNNKETATLCPTKAGNGYKVVVDGTWLYTSKASLLDMVNGKSKACTFSTIKDDENLNQ